MKEFDTYFSEIEKIPLLTLEEERTLATRAFSGDKKAQDRLVEANLRFVVKIASQYQGYMEIEDLVNEGNMGLMHAAEKYNPANAKGAKFSTYAVWWIKCYIQKAIREQSAGVRFPASRFEEMKKPEWKFSSLDKVIGNNDEDGETTLASFIADDRVKTPEDVFCGELVNEKVMELVKMLGPKEQFVIEKRFGFDGRKPKSLSEIGELMGFSKERVRQLEKKALAEMRSIACSSAEYAGLAA